MSKLFIDRPEGAPRTRADCANVQRPCPWVGCRYNMFLEVKTNGEIIRMFTEPHKMPEDGSCVLDIIERFAGRLNLREVATIWGISRERVRQIEESALRKVRKHHRKIFESLNQK